MDTVFKNDKETLAVPNDRYSVHILQAPVATKIRHDVRATIMHVLLCLFIGVFDNGSEPPYKSPLNSVSSQCACDKSFIARKPEVHSKMF